jgi:hypothetical protein
VSCHALAPPIPYFFFSPDQDPRGNHPIAPHPPERSCPSCFRHFASQPPSTPPPPCRAVRACLIDIDTWVSLDRFRFIQTTALFPFTHCFPAGSSARAQHQHPVAARAARRHNNLLSHSRLGLGASHGLPVIPTVRWRHFGEGSKELGNFSYVTGWPRNSRHLNNT